MIEIDGVFVSENEVNDKDVKEIEDAKKENS